jgi:hypothetical protein
MQDLKWQTLETRRKAARLILFHKAFNGETAVTIPEYVRKPSRNTRQYHQNRFFRLSTSTDAYQNRFMPKTIVDWNSLPSDVIQTPTTDCFREAVWRHLKP